MESIPYIAAVSAIAGLILAGYFFRDVKKADPGNDRMVHLMTEIQKGARAFLNQEYIFVDFLELIALRFAFKPPTQMSPYGRTKREKQSGGNPHQIL